MTGDWGLDFDPKARK